VAATGWNMHGDPVRIEGSHMLARAVQHETDHLDGVLFVDRLDAEAREAALSVLRDAAWQGEQAYLPSGEPAPTPMVKVSPH
jgi:peptide deformylase